MPYNKVTKLRSRLIIGTKQTLKAMKNGEVSEVFVADDADKHITEPVVDLAEELDIPCRHVNSMKKLGKASGVEVGASTVAVRK